MKVATGIVLFTLFAVTAVIKVAAGTKTTTPSSLLETTTKAATDTTVVKGTYDDITTHRISTRHFATTSINTAHMIPEHTTTTSTTSTPPTPTILTSTDTTRHTIIATTTSLFTTTTTTTPLIIPTTTNPRTTAQTTVKVELRFVNKEFNDNLSNKQSEEFKEFEKEFNQDMRVVYKDVPGYRDVKIQDIRSGSVIVDHDVIVNIVYSADITVTEQYKNILQTVQEELSQIVCGATKQINITNCISDNFNLKEDDTLQTEDDLCRNNVPPGFEEFYRPLITEHGLICVSHCDPWSPAYLDCNMGVCVLARGTGPHCLCPYTDSYMYMQLQCTGKISKIVLFVSAGVTIGILLILLVILGVFCCRIKNKAPKLLTEEETYYSTIK